MKRYLILLLALLCALPASAQADRHDVRAGNRKFRKERFKEAEIDYRKAVVRDSLSLTAQYFFNAGDAACQQKDWQAAVEAFKQALLQDPGDLDAKENYIYAKKMLENQQNGGGGGSDNNQNQDHNQNQDQNQDNQDQNQDNNQDQDQNQDQQDNKDNPDQNQQGQQPQISPQQAQQMLRAIQAKERETQDKVNKEKAALLKSRQKEKNW